MRAVRARLAEVAASASASHAETSRFADGRVVAAPARGLAFAEVVEQAYFGARAAVGDRFLPHAGPALGLQPEQGEPFHYFAYGAAVSEVEVDGFTGVIRTLRVDILHDVGDCLSPLVDLGQIEGGFVQGMGWLTSRSCAGTRATDDRGRLATQAASTYKLPSVGDAGRVPRRAARESATRPAWCTAARPWASRR